MTVNPYAYESYFEHNVGRILKFFSNFNILKFLKVLFLFFEKIRKKDSPDVFSAFIGTWKAIKEENTAEFLMARDENDRSGFF